MDGLVIPFPKLILRLFGLTGITLDPCSTVNCSHPLASCQDLNGTATCVCSTAEDLANTTDASLVQQFREEVVKALPDVNTFISLRQNLVSGKAKGDSQGEGLCCL